MYPLGLLVRKRHLERMCERVLSLVLPLLCLMRTQRNLVPEERREPDLVVLRVAA